MSADTLKVNCINKNISYLFHHKGNAGYDLYSTKTIWIFPFMIRKIPLNLKVELKERTMGFVTSRSGETLKGNIVIPGIIDPNYRGQLSALVTRVGLLPRRIKKGTRIAQMLIIPFKEYNVEIAELSPSSRGEKGFGSSGKY